VRELVTLDDVMDEMDLGPNGCAAALHGAYKLSEQKAAFASGALQHCMQRGSREAAVGRVSRCVSSTFNILVGLPHVLAMDGRHHMAGTVCLSHQQ